MRARARRWALSAAVACALCATAPELHAFAGAAASLKIVAELRLLYERLVDSVAELRRQTAAADEMRRLLEDAATSREVARDVGLGALLRRHRDALGARWDRDFGARADALLAEMRERVRRADDPAERERRRRDADALERIVARQRALDRLAAANARNLERSGADLSARESGRIGAQALSVIADQAIRQQREAAERERLAVQERQIEDAVLGTHRRLNRAMRAGGW